MKRDYILIEELERDGYDIIVDRTYEDLHPRDLFDDSLSDIQEICDNIDRGIYEWFILRVRVMVDGHELASSSVGGCLYENVKDVLSDGLAENEISVALEEAKKNAVDLKERLTELTTV